MELNAIRMKIKGTIKITIRIMIKIGKIWMKKNSRQESGLW